MIPEDVFQRLSDLTDREREVLGLVCEGLDYRTIGDDLVIEVPTVKSHMGNIYRKLGMIEVTRAQRRKALFEVYCPALREADLPAAPTEPEEPEPVPDEVEKMVEEDEKAIVLWKPDQIEIIPPPPPPVNGRRRPLRWMLVGMLLGALLIVSLFIRFGRGGGGEPLRPEPTLNIALAQVTGEGVMVLVTATPALPEPTATPVIQTREVVVVVTATPAPVTETPVPTAKLAANVLFEDNFDKDLSDAWQRGYGNAIVVNDMLTVDQETWLYIGDASWRDYVIEFEADSSSCWGLNIVAVRYTDADNMIAFAWADCESFWYVVVDGSWNEVPNSVAKPGFGMLRLTITVEGDRFTAHGDNQRLSSFFDNSFSQGGVALKLREDTLIDNFRVTSMGSK